MLEFNLSHIILNGILKIIINLLDIVVFDIWEKVYIPFYYLFNENTERGRKTIGTNQHFDLYIVQIAFITNETLNNSFIILLAM